MQSGEDSIQDMISMMRRDQVFSIFQVKKGTDINLQASYSVAMPFTREFLRSSSWAAVYSTYTYIR